MTHAEKVQYLYTDFKNRGIKKGIFAPPLYVLLWKLGIKIPPPHFSKFTSIFFVTGTFFALFWGIFTWLFIWSRTQLSIVDVVVSAIITGAVFGILIGSYYHRKSLKLNLPSWEDYPNNC